MGGALDESGEGVSGKPVDRQNDFVGKDALAVAACGLDVGADNAICIYDQVARAIAEGERNAALRERREQIIIDQIWRLSCFYPLRVQAFFDWFPDGKFENLRVIVAGDVSALSDGTSKQPAPMVRRCGPPAAISYGSLATRSQPRTHFARWGDKRSPPCGSLCRARLPPDKESSLYCASGGPLARFRCGAFGVSPGLAHGRSACAPAGNVRELRRHQGASQHVDCVVAGSTLPQCKSTGRAQTLWPSASLHPSDQVEVTYPESG